MKQHKFVLWSATGVLALVVAAAGLIGGVRSSRDQSAARERAIAAEAARADQQLCEATNRNKAALRTMTDTINEAARSAFLQAGLSEQQIDEIARNFEERMAKVIGPNVPCRALGG